MTHARLLTIADADSALSLYADLTLGPKDLSAAAFERVLAHDGTYVVGVESHGGVVAMATLHLLPNVTWGARPYGLIENVVTSVGHRRRGFGRTVMEEAARIAWAEDAYKIMLVAGIRPAVVDFYRSVGFATEDKMGMVMRRPTAA